MIKVAILGQGMVATHLAIGIERIKQGEIEPYGVPLAKYKLPYRIEDIDIAVAYDVDVNKIDKSLYEVAKELVGDMLSIPATLKDIYVREGIHLGSLRGLPFKATGLEEKMGLRNAIYKLIDDWKELGVDVIVNVITTEYGKPFHKLELLEKAVSEGNGITASHAYAYAVAMYSKDHRRAGFVNVIPTPLANDDAVVELYRKVGAVVLGDDGATGATPLTADLLEHLAERNRYVKFVVQFNIGGNTDFLALAQPERNLMKEHTKSKIVEDILGYDAPHYIKPTGYLEPLGDKKFVAMHLEYLTFNGLQDEIYVLARINDSPALAGKLVDLIRLAKIAVDRGECGTVYEINAFYMKKPGPLKGRAISKIVSYYKLLEWLGLKAN